MIKKPKFLYKDWEKKWGLKPNCTPQQQKEWLDREKERWVTGFGGLVGPHYFALTQCWIKDSEGTKIRPIWRDVDELIYGAYMDCVKKGEDLLVLKRREVGLSVIFGGVIPIWKCLTNRGATCLMTSADNDRIKELYDSKVRVTFDNLLADIVKPDVVGTRESGMLHMGRKNKTTGEVSGIDSKILIKNTSESPKAAKGFEAYRAQYVFIDEIFLHLYADVVHRSSQSTVKKGFRKIAPIVMGGSAGEASAEGAKLAKKLLKDAEILSINTLFLKGTLGIMEAPVYDENGKETGQVVSFCQNGWSDEEAAEKFILQTRKTLDKLEDKSYLISFTKSYPLTIEEVLSVNAAGILPEDIKVKLDAQERILLQNPPNVRKYNLWRDDSDQIHYEPSADGKFVFLRLPVPGHTHIAGTDPIPLNTKNLGDGSEYAIVIKDIDTNEYIAYYMERLDDAETVVYNSLLLQDMCNAKTMLEMNRGGAVHTMYKVLGRYDMLAYRPQALGIKYTDKTTSKGFYKNDHTAERVNEYLFKYLRQYSDTIGLTEIITQARVFGIENTDLIDAIQACELYHMNLVKLSQANRNQKPEKKMIPILENHNGTMVRVWKEVTL